MQKITKWILVLWGGSDGPSSSQVAYNHCPSAWVLCLHNTSTDAKAQLGFFFSYLRMEASFWGWNFWTEVVSESMHIPDSTKPDSS